MFDNRPTFDVILERLGVYYSVVTSVDDAGNCGIKINAKRDGSDVEIVSPSYPNETALQAGIIGHLQSTFTKIRD